MNPIRVLFERLTERLFGIISSHLGNILSAQRIACASEQLSQLEDLARQYEADGKPLLAEQVRAQAAAINSADPANDGAAVFDQLAGPSTPLGLPEAVDTAPAPKAKPRRQRRSRRCKETPVTTNIDTPENDGK